MIVIGIAGQAAHGKSTVAQIIRGFCPHLKVEVVPFAKALKEEASRLGWNGIKDEKGRKILQYLGTEVCRTIDENYWVNKFKQRVDSLKVDVIICDDVRFPNEMNALLEMGAYLIKVKKREKLLDIFKKKHASELCFDEEGQFNLVIENYWGLEALEKQVEQVIKDLKLRDDVELEK